MYFVKSLKIYAKICILDIKKCKNGKIKNISRVREMFFILDVKKSKNIFVNNHKNKVNNPDDVET